jgi:single-strand DNA-binding protein
MGHLAADPELKTTQGGHKMAKFKIVTNRDWQSSDGEHHEAADFHKIITWKKLAEITSQFLKKGSAVYLEGRITNYTFQSKEGSKHTTTEIVADVINFISYKKNKDGEEINLVEVPG